MKVRNGKMSGYHECEHLENKQHHVQCTAVIVPLSLFHRNVHMGSSSLCFGSSDSSRTIASLLSVRRRECRLLSCGTAGIGRRGGGF